MSGEALYLDRDLDARLGSGDEIVIAFDQPITLVGAGPSDLTLGTEVHGDGFGSAPTVRAGPGPHELTLTLDTLANFRTRGDFFGFDPRSPSGIDVSAGGGAHIRAADDGAAAVASGGVDIAPGYVPGPTLGASADAAAAVADLDRDGDLDVVLVGDGIRVWRNDRAAGFTLLHSAAGGRGMSGLVLGDLDRDGRTDAVITETGVGDRVWRNDGTGALVDTGQLLGVGVTTALALADLDRDGDLDLLTGEGSGGALRVHGNAGGTLQQAASYPNPPLERVRSLAVGDLDGDGDLDVVAGHDTDGGGAADRVHTNDGTGSLSDSGQRLGSVATLGIALLDLERDGDLDLFALAGGGPSSVWLNGGSGSFSDSGQVIDLGQSASVVLADIDRDGDSDALGAASSSVVVAKRDRMGSFRISRVGFATPAATTALATGDLDGDGDLDLVVAGAGGSRLHWSSLTGAAGMILPPFESTQGLGVDLIPHVGETADFDRDGVLDVLIGHEQAKAIVYFGRGDGTFATPGLRFGRHDGQNVVFTTAVGDFDGDGYPDVLESVNDARIYLSRNDRNNGFMAPVEVAAHPVNGVTKIVPADFDRDGDLDFVAAAGGNGLSSLVYLNQGNATFLPTAQGLPQLNQGRGVGAGDLDRDGDLDLVMSEDPGPTHVLLNDGAALFTEVQQYDPTGRTLVLALGDLDRDGDLDVYEGRIGIGTRMDRVFVNDGTGRFTDSGQSVHGQNTSAVELEDFDADGDIDAIVNGAAIYLNDGAGLLRVASSDIPNGLPNALIGDTAPGDLDGDGDLDLVRTDPANSTLNGYDLE